MKNPVLSELERLLREESKTALAIKLLDAQQEVAHQTRHRIDLLDAILTLCECARNLQERRGNRPLDDDIAKYFAGLAIFKKDVSGWRRQLLGLPETDTKEAAE